MMNVKSRTTRRGRPSLARMAAIEREILSTAGDLFLLEGFDVISMEKIARAAAVSKTTLYDRFPSKEALLNAVIRDRISRWSQIAGEYDHLTPRELGARLRHHAMTIARTSNLADVKGFQRLIFANAERFPDLAKIMYEAGHLYIVDFICRDIEAETARDGRLARDPKGAAAHFVSAVTGWIIQEGLAAPLTDEQIEAGACRCAELFLAARSAW